MCDIYVVMLVRPRDRSLARDKQTVGNWSLSQQTDKILRGGNMDK